MLDTLEIRKMCSHKVEINIDSPYKWGSGWTGTDEESLKLGEHFLMMLLYFGHNLFDDGGGVIQGQGFDDLPELSYMHPMQPVIYCNGQDRADEIIKIFKEHPLDMYKIKSIRIENTKTKDSQWIRE